MKTKLIALILVLSMTLIVFAGCGNTATSTASSATSSAAAVEASASTTAEEAPTAVQAEDTETSEAEEATSAEEPEGPAEDVELQPTMTDETAALIAETAEEANAVSYSDFEGEPSDLWKFVESDEYQTAINEVRADINAVMPTSETNYDEDGRLLSCKGATYDYPLDDGHSITVFACNRGLTSNYVSSLDELITFKIAATETNIDAEFTTVPGDAAETQMNLLLASGDYPDVLSYFSAAYSGTETEAYDNDLIISLNDYLEEYCPNYNAWLQSNDIYAKTVTADDGNIYAFDALRSASAIEQGSWVRTDLIDKFGIDVPSTVSEMEEYFALCKDEGLSSVISCGAYGFAILSSAFGIPDLSSDNGFGIGLYKDGTDVKSILTSDNSDRLQEYISTLHEWYEDGYYAPDLVSYTSSDDTEVNNLVYNGETAYMWAGSGHYSNYVQQAAVEGWDIEPTPTIVMNEGDTNHFMPVYYTESNTGNIVISSQCEDLEAACRYVDWFYSDMGIETLNYGPEGVTWNWSEDGTKREFTSAIYNDVVYDLDAAPVWMMYTGSTTWASVSDPLYNLYFGSSMVPVECQKLWAQNNDDENYLNTSALSLTSEESEDSAQILSDLETYLEETLTKFLIGDLDVEKDWDDFEETLTNMGIEDVVEIYQTAYDRYLER